VDTPRTDQDAYDVAEECLTRAICWVDEVRKVSPDRPWFACVSFGPIPAPSPRSRRSHHRGRVGYGSEQRGRTLVQGQSGLATHRTQRPSAGRRTDPSAAWAEHVQAQVGRFVQHLERTGELDATIVLH
jgi:arylsulfatase